MTTSSLRDAVELRVRLFIEKVSVHTLRPERGYPPLPARAFFLQGRELDLQRLRLGVVLQLGLEAMLAIGGAPYEVAARDPEHEIEHDRQNDRAQARSDHHTAILGGRD